MMKMAGFLLQSGTAYKRFISMHLAKTGLCNYEINSTLDSICSVFKTLCFRYRGCVPHDGWHVKPKQ